MHAKGNIIVDANNNSQFDKVIGVVAGGATGAGAAAVAVSSTVKLTEAFIGQGAKVNADGQGSSAVVKTGKFDIDFVPDSKATTGINATGGVSGSSSTNALKEQGEVGPAKTGDMKPTKDSQSATEDQSNSGQRTLTPATRSGFRGLSVTASSRDDIEVYTISVGIGGSGAVAVSAGVSAVDNEAKAYISDGAQINTEAANAHTDQSVNVTAGSDYSQIAINGSLAAGAGGAFSLL